MLDFTHGLLRLMVGMAIMMQCSFQIRGQASCPSPTIFLTDCTSAVAQCDGSTGICSYTTTFSTSFNGKNKYARITIYANRVQVHQECIGPLPSGTNSYAVSYNATCNANISGAYIAYTSSSAQSPCGGKSCDVGSCNGASCQSGVLPITLKSFVATSLSDVIHLQWITSSEWNNEFFEVQKSDNGFNWTNLASIPGRGDSEDENRYDIFDPFPHIGMNYYRLIQYDFDGESEISGIVSVEHKIHKQPLSLFENGAILVLSEHLKEPVRSVIVDVQGRVLLNKQLDPGSSHSLENLPAGIYVVHLKSRELNYSERFTLSHR